MNEEEKLARCLYGEDNLLIILRQKNKLDGFERFRTFIALLLLLQRGVVK
mgnify:CR=1 FL=1